MKSTDWTREIPGNVSKIAIRYEIIARNPNNKPYVHSHGTMEEIDRAFAEFSHPEHYHVRRVVTVTHVDIA